MNAFVARYELKLDINPLSFRRRLLWKQCAKIESWWVSRNRNCMRDWS